MMSTVEYVLEHAEKDYRRMVDSAHSQALGENITDNEVVDDELLWIHSVLFMNSEKVEGYTLSEEEETTYRERKAVLLTRLGVKRK